MHVVILGIHLFICVALILLVLLQRSEGGALGMGGGGGGALMTGRGAADALARMTSFAGAFFLATSLLLTVISGASRSGEAESGVFDFLRNREAPAAAPATTTAPPPAEPARQDPTEGAVQTDTQLASAATPTPPEVAPAPANAAQRAGPVAAAPAAAQQRPPATTQRTAATSTQRPAATPAPANAAPATVTPARATTTTPTNSTPPRTNISAAAPPPVNATGGTTGALPASNPGSAGIDLPAAQLNPESNQAQPDTPIRRERAGPDQ